MRPSLVILLSLAAGGLVMLCGVSAVRTSERSLLIEAHQAKGVSCGQCHKETAARSASTNQDCTDCHGDQTSLALRTAKADPNPHASPHLPQGQTQVCSDCHHIHKPSEVACSDCHRSFKFNVK
jgi:ribosomal protein L37AE/L43A